MEKELLAKKIELLFNKISNSPKTYDWNMNMNSWDWNPGVCLIGLAAAYKKTNKKEYMEYLEKWFFENENQRFYGSVNNIAPGIVPLILAEEKLDYRFLDVIKEHRDWCLTNAYVTDNGGYSHIWKGGDADFINQLWIDTIYMTAIFLTKYGVMFHHKRSINEAISQINIHLSCLFDREKSLCYHGYHCGDKKKLGQFWGRGNGWIVSAIAQVLDHLKDVECDKSNMLEKFQAIMESAYAFKSEGGLLHTLIDEEDSYIEVTASCLFGYAAKKGYDIGILPEKFLHWSIQITQSVMDNIDDQGKILNCSGGTDPSTKEVYMSRPLTDTMYAYGLALMLLSEFEPEIELHQFGG